MRYRGEDRYTKDVTRAKKTMNNQFNTGKKPLPNMPNGWISKS